MLLCANQISLSHDLSIKQYHTHEKLYFIEILKSKDT